MNAEIVSIGTELLMGSVVNTNAAYIARRLAEHGVNVYWQTVVGDNPTRLREALELAFSRADVVIATGGLGPTDDDLTKEVAAEYFGMELIAHQPSLGAIAAFFKRAGKVASEKNLKQGYFPKDAMVFPNAKGTAPGCLIEQGGKVLILLPGPPSEMEAMFESGVVPFLKQKQDCLLVAKNLRVVGMGESAIADVIDDIIKGQSNPTIATFAADNECVVRITARAASADEAEQMIKPMADEVCKRLDMCVYAEGERTLEETVAKLLTKRNLTVTFAESCTGGLLAGRFVNAAGVSGIFRQSFVTYSNISKIQRLGVSEKTLGQYGSVSEQTAGEMAAGAAKAAAANVGIAITGIAGPDGGTVEKPVGTVCIGVCINGVCHTQKHVFAGDRTRVRQRAVVSALDFLRIKLLNE